MIGLPKRLAATKDRAWYVAGSADATLCWVTSL